MLRLIVYIAAVRTFIDATAATTIAPSSACVLQGGFYCNRSSQCINLASRCDGIYECSSGEDEIGCPVTTTISQTAAGSPSTTTSGDSCLQLGFFYCNQSNQCISAFYRCDGSVDCYYGEDERRCGTTTPRTTTRGSPSTTNLRDVCLQLGFFYCNQSNQCISAFYRCDGSVNCFYGEDESRCGTSTPRTTTRGGPPIDASRDSCRQLGAFYCNQSRQCISANYRCDGYFDCRFGDDESTCGTSTPSTETTVATVTTTISPMDSCVNQWGFYCNRSMRCIYIWLRCDGNYDCYYGDDETGCFPTTTQQTTTGLSTAVCGGNFSGSGIIQSPGYPSTYANSLLCTWNLQALSPNFNIILIIQAFSTESGFDYLSIIDGQTKLIQRYSGTTIPSIITLGSQATLSFMSDSIFVRSGFSILFTSAAAPATTTISPTGSCVLQGGFYCIRSMQCIYLWQRCNGNYDCYYGDDETGCFSTTTRQTTAAPTCGGDVVVGSATIKSPNYPSSYPNNARCEWNLQAPYNSKIILQFLHFDTESCCDYLRVYDDSGRVYSFSGPSLPSTIIVGRSGRIVFSSDGSVVGSGFFLSLKSLSSAATAVRHTKIPYVLMVIYATAPSYV